MADTKTMYVHTLDGKPARLVRFTRGRVAMIPVTPNVRIKPLPSLDAIRRERCEVVDDEFAASQRDHPDADREVHKQAAFAMIERLGYFLVEVPADVR